MNYKIILKDVPCAVDVPEKSYYIFGEHTAMYKFHEQEYENALQQAIDNAVPFLDREGTLKLMARQLENTNYEGKLYKCPKGYRIEIEKGFALLKPVK